MNIHSVHQNNVNSIYRKQAEQDRQNSGFLAGQILEGIVTETGSQVSMDFSGRTLSFPSESVPGAYCGQIRKFEVLEAGENGVKLKELGSNQVKNIPGKLPVQVDNAPVTAHEQAIPEDEASEEQEQAKNVAGRMTGKDYSELAKEGFTLESFELERLARALERIKAGRQQRDMDVERFQEKKRDTRESIRDAAEKLLNGRPGSQYLAELFEQMDIPVTEEKIREVTEAVGLGGELLKRGLSDGAKAFLISNEQKPSIRNLYQASFNGRNNAKPVSDDVWQQLRASAESVLRESGMENNEKNLQAARYLVEYELPVTAQNIRYKNELDRLEEACNPQEMLEKVLVQASEGRPAADALLGKDSQMLEMELEVNSAIHDLKQILPETVDAAAELLQSRNETSSFSLSFLKNLQQELSGSNAHRALQEVTARRRLEEVRLKLTADAGLKLVSRGIHLYTDDLDKIVQGLRDLENEYYSGLYLETSSKKASEEELSLLRQTAESVAQIKQAPMQILGETFVTRHIETLTSLRETGNRLAAQYAQAGERYEALMTKPRADMGDRLDTAFRNVDSLLEQMKLEPTEANRRAVRMITYSHAELNEENLTRMKEYDATVRQLLRDMNPAACARMIQNGVNPLRMPLAELSDTLRDIQEREGATTEEKFSNFLVKLDRKHELTKQERDAYIGVYRLLHQIVKSDGAAAGALAAEGRELTLENLLSAIRTRKKGGIDAAVDEQFGGIDGGKAENDIAGQIEEAFTQIKTAAVYVQNYITPEAMDKLGGPEQLLQMHAQDIAEQMADAVHEDEDMQFGRLRAQEMTDILANCDAECAFLQSYGQAVTTNTLHAAREFLSGRSIYGTVKRIAEKYGMAVPDDTGDAEVIEHAENLRDAVEEWNDSADKTIEQLFEQAPLTGEDSSLLLWMRGAIQLTGALADRECYEIPLRAESGFVKLNLTVRHSGADRGLVRAAFRGTKQNLSFELRMEGKRISCYMVADSSEALSALQAGEDNMKKSLMEQGFEITRWDYGVKTRSDGGEMYGNFLGRVAGEHTASEETRTDDMYLAAKTLIQIMQEGQVHQYEN